MLTFLQEDEGWPNSSSSNNGKRNNNGVAAERDPAGSGVYTASRPGVWRLKGGSLRIDDASQLPPLMLVRTQGRAGQGKRQQCVLEQLACMGYSMSYCG
jgi:hypothetical protein